MKNIKKYLILMSILFVAPIYSMEACTQPQDIEITTIINALEKVEQSADVDTELNQLIDAALSSQKPSFSKRAGLDAVRLIVKYGGLFTCFYCACKATKSQHSQLIAIPLVVLSVIVPVIVELQATKLKKSIDQSLVTMQNLEKYITSLSSEQKIQIGAMFKEKIEKLENKSLTEKDGAILNFDKNLIMLLELIFIIFWFIAHPLLLDCYNIKDKIFCENVRSLFTGKKWQTFWLGNTDHALLLLASTIYIPMLLSNAKNTNEYQKDCALKKIEAALK